jgi:hypothetical protein
MLSECLADLEEIRVINGERQTAKGEPVSTAPGVIRTHNLLIRSQMLYPVELRVRTGWEGYLAHAQSLAKGGRSARQITNDK